LAAKAMDDQVMTLQAMADQAIAIQGMAMIQVMLVGELQFRTERLSSNSLSSLSLW